MEMYLSMSEILYSIPSVCVVGEHAQFLTPPPHTHRGKKKKIKEHM